MAGASLFALIDDIASILDDVAVLTKVAAKKTAGVLGDDLALNAQQVTGLQADRELPVVWAVAKGSALNKAILVPAALAISAFIPWLVTPLLMLGGLYLCYEGVEKIAHKFFPHAEEEEHEDEAARAVRLAALADPAIDLVALEKGKIKGAIRTDFILSAEIVTIALGTVATMPFGTRVAVLLGVSTLMTVGVYGLVAGIVKLDDLGLYLVRKGGASGGRRAIGGAILRGAPWLMKALSIIGTAAMFLVGGSIIVHGVPPLEHLLHDLLEPLSARGAFLGGVASTLADAVVGIVAGGIVVGVVHVVKHRRAPHPSTSH